LPARGTFGIVSAMATSSERPEQKPKSGGRMIALFLLLLPL
jgi:hypothetical protein